MELKKLISIIAEVMNVDPDSIDADTSFADDLGADSIDIGQIMIGIEEEFDIEVDPDAFEKIVTVGDAAEQIRNMIS